MSCTDSGVAGIELSNLCTTYSRSMAELRVDVFSLSRIPFKHFPHLSPDS
jgi:hypothetical protein